MTTTTTKGIAVPEEGDPPLVPQDIGAVATWLDTNPGIAALSQTEINALAGIDLWVGRVVWNETTSQHQGYNGVTWVPIGAGVQSFTQAAIDALPGAQKSIGMIVWNTTVGYHQAWNGASWEFVNDVPRVTTAQRDALTKFAGMLVWNTTTSRHEWWNGIAWDVLGRNAGGAFGYITSGTLAGGPVSSAAFTTIKTLTFQGIAGRRYRIGGVVQFNMATNADIANVRVFDNVTVIPGCDNGMTIAAGQYGAVGFEGSIVTGPAARTITINVGIANSFNTGAVSVQRGFVVVEDDGEDGQVGTPTTITPPDIWNAAWGVLAQAKRTVTQAGIGAAMTDLTGLAVTPALVLGRRYKLTLFLPVIIPSAGGIAQFAIYDGANTELQKENYIANGAGYHFNVTVVATYDALTAGPMTFKARAATTVGTIDVSMAATAYGIIMAEDVGPTTPVSSSLWPPKGGGTKVPWVPVLRQNNIVLPATFNQADLTRIGDRVNGEIFITVNGPGTAASQVQIDWPNGWKPALIANNHCGWGYISATGGTVAYFALGGAGGLSFYNATGIPFTTALKAGDVINVQFSFLSAT